MPSRALGSRGIEEFGESLEPLQPLGCGSAGSAQFPLCCGRDKRRNIVLWLVWTQGGFFDVGVMEKQIKVRSKHSFVHALIALEIFLHLRLTREGSLCAGFTLIPTHRAWASGFENVHYGTRDSVSGTSVNTAILCFFLVTTCSLVWEDRSALCARRALRGS